MRIEPELAKRLEKLKGLPSPPRVAMRIIESANDPDISLSKVADVVTADPVIAAKLMRTANSAVYARPGGCSTLRQALVLLGLDATLIIALSFTLVMSLRRDRSRGLDHESYWRRSLLAATAAKALGRALGRSDQEALFLGALLQDIGMLALDKLEPELYQGAGHLVRQHAQLPDYERQALGADHAVVGAWLMQRWRLPDLIVNAIANSHEPKAPGDDGFARCIALSGPLADVWMSADWSLSFGELVGLAVECLGLNPVQIGMVLDELREQIPETEAMFEKDLIDPAQGFTAMEEARELLMQKGVEAFTPAREMLHKNPVVAPVTMLRIQHQAELQDVLDKEFSSAMESGQDAAVIVAELDGLDEIRQGHGTETAERMLREAALVLLDNSGARVVGQHAHNQLLLWVENTNHQGVQLTARRTLKAFEQAMNDLTGSSDLNLGVALGVAAMDADHPRSTITELLDAAQVALGNARFGSVSPAEKASLAQTV